MEKSAAPSAAPAAAPFAALSWRPLALAGGALLCGDWLLRDLVHLPGGGLTLLAGAGALWLCRRPRLPQPTGEGQSLAGLRRRCETALARFESLEADDPAAPARQARRGEELAAMLDRHHRSRLSLAVVGTVLPDPAVLERLRASLAGCGGMVLHWTRPLSSRDPRHRWPQDLTACDGLLFHVPQPLSAADRCWLAALPPDLPTWLLVSGRAAATQELLAQLPAERAWTLLPLDGGAAPLTLQLTPLRRELQRSPRLRIAATERRLLLALHGRWQGELERLRRQRFRRLLATTQWSVAAAVLASPVPAVDLLAVSVANGLMLREMALLWDCPWGLEALRAAAIELGRAALAQGVVEWTSQALLSLTRLDGTTWLVAGGLQALSAAYLTRVVGRSMADLLAASQGVSAADVAGIRRQAPLLVARAAEAERLDWSAFLAQARSWALGAASRPALPLPEAPA